MRARLLGTAQSSKKIHRINHRALRVAFERLLAGRRDVHFLVGVSGGKDSTLLAHHCPELGRLLNCRFTLAHINHRQRGMASEADAKFCHDLALSLQLPFCTRSFPDAVGNASASEEKLRAMRYAMLEELRLSAGAHYIVVAHHAQDQCETVLMRLFQGADVHGLSAMPVLSPSGVFRPMLDLEKEAIDLEVKLRGIAYREDASNTYTHLSRNWIRHELLPRLRAHVNPGVVSTVCELAKSFSDLDGYLEPQALQLVEHSRIGAHRFRLGPLKAAPRAILYPALQYMFSELTNGRVLTRKHIYMLGAAVYKGRGRVVLHLPFERAAFIVKGALHWCHKKEVQFEG